MKKIPENAAIFVVDESFGMDRVLAIKQDAQDAMDGGRPLVFDLKGCTEIDSYALGFLVNTRNKAQERGLTVHLLEPSDPVRKLLKITRLEDRFEVVDGSR